MLIKKHLDLLGCPVVDKVTGFKGVVDSVSFDLYGCVQASLMPPVDKKGELSKSYWFDVNRLEIKSTKLVMEVPDFEYGIQAEGKQGPADKQCRFNKQSG